MDAPRALGSDCWSRGTKLWERDCAKLCKVNWHDNDGFFYNFSLSPISRPIMGILYNPFGLVVLKKDSMAWNFGGLPGVCYVAHLWYESLVDLCILGEGILRYARNMDLRN